MKPQRMLPFQHQFSLASAVAVAVGLGELISTGSGEQSLRNGIRIPGNLAATAAATTNENRIERVSERRSSGGGQQFFLPERVPEASIHDECASSRVVGRPTCLLPTPTTTTLRPIHGAQRVAGLFRQGNGLSLSCC